MDAPPKKRTGVEWRVLGCVGVGVCLVGFLILVSALFFKPPVPLTTSTYEQFISAVESDQLARGSDGMAYVDLVSSKENGIARLRVRGVFIDGREGSPGRTAASADVPLSEQTNIRSRLENRGIAVRELEDIGLLERLRSLFRKAK